MFETSEAFAFYGHVFGWVASIVVLSCAARRPLSIDRFPSVEGFCPVRDRAAQVGP